MMRKSNAVVQAALTKGTRGMNSHKFNMYAGAVIGSLLAFLLLNFFSDLIYVGRGHSEHESLAFAVAVEESAGGGTEAAAVDYAALVAKADPANGEKVFGKCKACHQVADGANGVGPYLWGVVGRKIASAAGYSYSDSLAGIAGNWDLAHLSSFLAGPKAYAPGTKMGFAGLKKVEDRVDVIAYLNQADGTPMDLAPAGSAAEAASGTSSVAAVKEAVTAGTGAAAETAATVTETVKDAVTETVTAATEAVAAATGGEDYASLLASADAAAGEKTFKKCKACHKAEEGKNGVGPSLWGVVGRKVGSADGFNYSDAMKSHDGDWTGANLFAYLADPKAFIPGNKMSFPGLKAAQDRVNVIVYLNEADGTPEPLQ
ncbi:MAG: cytochrome c family protein [Xanthomonadales bacterium]|nr:cytochrome c family protein [Xanthomonadales bacterium]